MMIQKRVFVFIIDSSSNLFYHIANQMVKVLRKILLYMQFLLYEIFIEKISSTNEMLLAKKSNSTPGPTALTKCILYYFYTRLFKEENFIPQVL